MCLNVRKEGLKKSNASFEEELTETLRLDTQVSSEVIFLIKTPPIRNTRFLPLK